VAELDTPSIDHAANRVDLGAHDRGAGGGAKETSSAAGVTSRDAAGSAAIDRISHGPAAEYRTLPQLLDGTVDQLHAFSGDQADWPTRLPTDAGHGRSLWLLLELLQREPSLLAGCGKMKVSALLAAGVPGAHVLPMLRYAKAVTRAYDTVELEQTPDPMRAIWSGLALQKLETAIGGGILKLICRGGGFDQLLDSKLVDAFIDYVRVVKPLLTAENGAEISSFALLHEETGHKPSKFVGRVKHVRNHHHFTAVALEKLAQNETDT